MSDPIKERTHGEKLAFLAGYTAAVEAMQRSGLEVAAAAAELMAQTLDVPGRGETQHPEPGGLPKIPQSAFNMERRKKDV